MRALGVEALKAPSKLEDSLTPRKPQRELADYLGGRGGVYPGRYFPMRLAYLLIFGPSV